MRLASFAARALPGPRFVHDVAHPTHRATLPRCARRAPAIQCSQSFESWQRKATQAAKDAQQKLEKWAEEQQVQKKVQQTLETVQDTVQRTAQEIDREYDVKGKAQQASEKVKEAADSVESKYGVGRRARNAYQDARRNWPKWQRQMSEFFGTPAGQVAGVLLLFMLLYTGVLFHIIKWFYLILFMGPLFVIPIANYLRAKEVEEEAARQQEFQRQQEEATRSQQQQFMQDLFGRFQPGGGARRQQQQGGRAPRDTGAARGRWGGRSSGQTIDVEWEPLDDK